MSHGASTALPKKADNHTSHLNTLGAMIGLEIEMSRHTPGPLHGLNIFSHPLARDIRTEWKVERNPIKKKRKGWRVVKQHIDRPGCYQIGNTLYMHPELFEKLRDSIAKAEGE